MSVPDDCFQGDIQKAFSDLCVVTLKNYVKKRYLTSYNYDIHLRCFKKKLYHTLYLNLYSPFIPVTTPPPIYFEQSFSKDNDVYKQLAEKAFEFQLTSQEQESISLNYLVNKLRINDTKMGSVLILLLKLSEVNKLHKVTLNPFKFHENSYFQLDSKVFSINDCFPDIFDSSVENVTSKKSLFGLPTELLNLSKDEGFHELSTTDLTEDCKDDLDIWDVARTAQKDLPSWENRRCSTSFYITEHGNAAFDSMYQLQLSSIKYLTGSPIQLHTVTNDLLLDDTLHVLVGIPSSSYCFDKVQCVLTPVTNVYCSGFSVESLGSMMSRFAAIGTAYIRLERFCSHHNDRPVVGQSGGLVLKAFIDALNNILHSYQTAVFLTDGHSFSLLELWFIFQKYSSQLRFLNDICLCSEAFRRCETEDHSKPKFPVGAKLLSYMYAFCTKNSSTEHYELLLYLFKSASEPYVSFISEWLFNGRIHDVYGEFFIETDHKALTHRDKHFWSQAFRLKQNTEKVPLFLYELIEPIFSCGKAINLLKLTNINHFLFDPSIIVPSIGITFSASMLDSIERNCEHYIKSVHDCEVKMKTLKEQQKLEQEEIWKMKIAHERKMTENALKKITDLEEEIRETIRNKKKAEFEMFQKQYHEFVEVNRSRRAVKLKEDEFWLEEMERANEKDDDVRRKAREDILSYYEKMSALVDQREFRANWFIRRCQLTDKRMAYFKEASQVIKDEVQKMNSEGSEMALKIQDEEMTTPMKSDSQKDDDDVLLFTTVVSNESKLDVKMLSLKKETLSESEEEIIQIPQERKIIDCLTELNKDEEIINEAAFIPDGNKSSESTANEIESNLINVENSTGLKTVSSGNNHPSFETQQSQKQADLVSGGGQVIKKRRIVEVKTKDTIKELMYPILQSSAVFRDDRSSLPDLNVWMDSVVEPYQDTFPQMDLPPQPYQFGNVSNVIKQRKDENDVIGQLPLETIIRRSLTHPIRSHISLVNRSVVSYFLHDLNISTHFNAFRKFLLMEDGEFGHSLCSQLFEKLESGITPQEFCNTMRLSNIISEALRMSLDATRIEYANQLTFNVKSVPDVFSRSDVATWDFLELRYQVAWPSNIIVTENSITKYNKVFSFLLRLKKAGWSLQKVYFNLKKAGHDRITASSPQLRHLQLSRHEMQHFVNNVERYIVNQIIHVSWREFQHDLTHKVHSLDDLHKCHVTYLNKIIFRSLLSKNAAPVYKLINDIFALIFKFETRLLSADWLVDNGHMTHPLFEKLKSVQKAFRQSTEFLFSVISKLVRRGYQDHLDDLLLQVNFNDYYTATAGKKTI